MVLKKISVFLALLLISFLIVFTAPKIARAAILRVGPESGPAGSDISIRTQDFCVNNPGTLVNIYWNDHLIVRVGSPNYSLFYQIPSSASPNTYQITGIAACPGLPPAIPAYADYGAATFEVTSSGTSATPTSSSGAGASSSPGASSNSDPSTSASISASASAAVEEAKQNEQNKSNPWYKNWKYILVLNVLFLVLIAGIIFTIVFEKHKHQKKELEQVMPRIKKEGK
jgi:hypothetical protein